MLLPLLFATYDNNSKWKVVLLPSFREVVRTSLT